MDLQWLEYDHSSGIPEWSHYLEADPDYTWGTFEDGAPIDVTSMCGGANSTFCLAVDSDPPQGTPVLFAPYGDYFFHWTEDADSALQVADLRDELTGALGVNFSFPGQDSQAFDDGTFNGEGGPEWALSGRCDTQTAGRTPGCVDPEFTPTLTYNSLTNPLVAPVAQHIYDAQRSLSTYPGVPGSGSGPNGAGVPLTRLADDGLAAENRAVACPDGTYTPPDTCDEYPLAHSYEGAFTNPVPGQWSRAPVPSSANSSQGGLTAAFFADNRVLDKDAFWVNVVLADGTTSW